MLQMKLEKDQGEETAANLKEIISCFTTGDEALDNQNMDLVVETLYGMTN